MASQHRELIRKYISGNCTEAERRKVAMLLADPTYQSLFEDLLAEEGNPIVPSHDAADEQLARWTEKIQQRIAQPQQKRRWLFRPAFYKYAAAWIFALCTIAGIGYLTFRGSMAERIAYTEKYNDGTAPLHILLADSSVVMLGPGSKLSYPETFTSDSRRVLLEGEAFFQVQRDTIKPFFVSSGDVRTKVLGTSFKVTAFEGRPTSVAVATGKVRVDHMADNNPEELAVLTPGQQMAYADGRTVRSEVSIAQLEGWQEGRLTYRNTPLKHITDDLERWYGIRVTYLESSRAALHLDMNLTTDAALESTLRILSATGGFTYEINGNTVTIND
jgi:transmembrane sensor